MSEIKACKCDRCGDIVEKGRIKLSVDHIRSPEREELELCESCSVSFEHWVSNYE